MRSRVLQESWRIQFYYTINVILARRGRNMGGLVVNQPVGRGFKHQLRVLLPMTIAPGRLAVSFPTLLQQLDFGFWCDAEPPKSENCGAHRNAPCALDHWTSTAGTRHRCRGRRDVARVANVLKHAVQPIAECDQIVPGHLGFPSRT
jgi:hypothetical protein